MGHTTNAVDEGCKIFGSFRRLGVRVLDRRAVSNIQNFLAGYGTNNFGSHGSFRRVRVLDRGVVNNIQIFLAG